MNASEYNEFADDSEARSDQIAFVTEMELARLDVGAAWAYIATIRDRYEAEPRSIPAIMVLRRVADFVAHTSDTAEFPDEVKDVTDAFYEGALLAYDVTARHYDEDWPEQAALLFADGMHDYTERYRGDMWTPEQMQRAADDIVLNAEWDVEDEEDMPLDAMVRKWATEIYGFSDKQRYMLMGYRHILTQIVKHDIDQDEKATFEAMMVEAELDNDIQRTRSINAVRDAVLATVAERKDSFGPVDMDDPLRVTAALNNYTYGTEGLMQAQDELVRGDDITLHGIDTTYVVYGDDDTSDERKIELLAPHETLEGEFMHIEMTRIPVIESASQLRQRVEGKSGDAWIESSIGKYEIVPLMVLKQATIIRSLVPRRDIPAGSGLKKVEPSFADVPQNKYVAVVLNPNLAISVYE